MTRAEAIKEMQSYADNSWGGLSEAFELAITALREQEQREQGCEYCKVWGGMYCPVCGRRLEY